MSRGFVEVPVDLDCDRLDPGIRVIALPVNITARRSSDRYQYQSDPTRRSGSISRRRRRRSNVPVSRRPARRRRLRRRRPRSPSRIRRRCYRRRRPWRNRDPSDFIRSSSRARDLRSFAKDPVFLSCSRTRRIPSISRRRRINYSFI